MTVKELIDRLEKCPMEYIVWIEGCDCMLEPKDVDIEIYDDDEIIYINTD